MACEEELKSSQKSNIVKAKGKDMYKSVISIYAALILAHKRNKKKLFSN